MRTSVDLDLDVYQALVGRFTPERPDASAVLRDLLAVAPAATASAVASTAGQARPVVTIGSVGAARKPVSPQGAVARIGLLGATGMIGREVAAEALRRGIEVRAVLRDPSRIEAGAGLEPVRADANNADGLKDALAGLDAAVVAVKWDQADAASIVAGLRAAGVARAIFVIGCGTLLREDGRLHFHHAFEAKGVPAPPTVPALKVLDLLKQAPDLEWTAISCPKSIGEGERTASFRLGGERMLFDDAGASAISTADFAIAIVDELEAPRHVRQQFTAAY